MDPRAHPPPHSDTASKSDKRMRESTVLGNWEIVRTKVVKCKRQWPTSKLSIKGSSESGTRTETRM